MKRGLLCTLIFFITSNGIAADVCSRVATINYQEILTDTGSTGRGEGLRYYLEKDPKSKELLDLYQQKSRPSWVASGVSTLGTGIAIYGMMSSGEGGTGLSNPNNLILGGVTMVLFSYLTTRATQRNNELILKSAVDEYNKRNRPTIQFSPFKTQTGIGGSFQLQKGF